MVHCNPYASSKALLVFRFGSHRITSKERHGSYCIFALRYKILQDRPFLRLALAMVYAKATASLFRHNLARLHGRSAELIADGGHQ